MIIISRLILGFKPVFGLRCSRTKSLDIEIMHATFVNRPRMNYIKDSSNYWFVFRYVSTRVDFFWLLGSAYVTCRGIWMWERSCNIFSRTRRHVSKWLMILSTFCCTLGFPEVWTVFQHFTLRTAQRSALFPGCPTSEEARQLVDRIKGFKGRAQVCQERQRNMIMAAGHQRKELWSQQLSRVFWLHWKVSEGSDRIVQMFRRLRSHLADPRCPRNPWNLYFDPKFDSGTLVWVFGMFRPCLFPIDSEISEVQTDDHGAAQKVYDELLKLDAQCQQLSTAIWSSKGQLHPGHKITREWSIYIHFMFGKSIVLVEFWMNIRLGPAHPPPSLHIASKILRIS